MTVPEDDDSWHGDQIIGTPLYLRLCNCNVLINDKWWIYSSLPINKRHTSLGLGLGEFLNYQQWCLVLPYLIATRPGFRGKCDLSLQNHLQAKSSNEAVMYHLTRKGMTEVAYLSLSTSQLCYHGSHKVISPNRMQSAPCFIPEQVCVTSWAVKDPFVCTQLGCEDY